jgi:hypothetical protein
VHPTQRLVAVEVRWLSRPEIRAVDLLDRIRTLAGTEVELLGDTGPAQGFAFPSFVSTFSDGSVPMQVWLALPDAAHQQPLSPDAFRQTWDWADAVRVLGEARESLLVTDLMAGGVAPVDRLRMLHAVLRSVVEAYRPVGLYVLSSERAVEADAYLETVAADPAAFASTVNVRLFTVDGETGEALFDTLGMAPLGLPDVQLRFTGLELDAAARWVFNVGYYLFLNGDVIEDGHTLSGVDPDEAWPCRHRAAMAAPERGVLDADPWPHGPRRAQEPEAEPNPGPETA